MARKMKDSGIEWIGEIPEGWSIARGKHILTLLQRAVSLLTALLLVSVMAK